MTLSGLIFWIAVIGLWFVFYSKRKSSKLAAAAVDLFLEEDDDDLRIPRQVRCPRCNANLDLTRFERRSAKFTCARCNTISEVSSLSFDLNTQKWTAIFQLLPYADCPKCRAPLELSREERIAGEFICPECKHRTESTSGAQLSQYHLPKHLVCPECSNESTLLDLERNNSSFVCPSCHQVIHYVEE